MKLLFLDIETAPHKVYTWQLRTEYISPSDIVEPGYTLCFAAKWYGSPKVIFGSVFHQKPSRMFKEVHKLLDDADAVVHFNGKKFDVPTLNKEFLLHGLSPPAPFRHIDLLQTCRQQFRFASNKLDYVSQVLGVGAKVHHKGMQLWRGCMSGDAASWRVMESYNKHDVKLTERLYVRLLPWISNHPNRALYDEDSKACISCGGDKLQARGYAYTTAYRYKRFQCRGCGRWQRSSKNYPMVRPQRKAIA